MSKVVVIPVDDWNDMVTAMVMLSLEGSVKGWDTQTAPILLTSLEKIEKSLVTEER